MKLIKILWKTTRIPVISGLVNIFDLRYSQPAAAKSAAGICTPEIYKDRFIIFTLCVNAFAHLLHATLPLTVLQYINGGSGGAAFGLAGVLVGRYCELLSELPPKSFAPPVVVVSLTTENAKMTLSHSPLSCPFNKTGIKPISSRRYVKKAPHWQQNPALRV